MIRGRLNEARTLILHVAARNHVQLSHQLETELGTWEQQGDSSQVTVVLPFLATTPVVRDLWAFVQRLYQQKSEESTWKTLKQVTRSRKLLWRLVNCSFCW